MTARRLTPSIDEIADDARRMTKYSGLDWRGKFRQLLRAYGYRVEREGGAIVDRGRVLLYDWEIVR